MLGAVRSLYEDLGLLVEPAGAVGVAAIAAARDLDAGALVATPLCGGSLTDEQVRAWILPGALSETERKWSRARLTGGRREGRC